MTNNSIINNACQNQTINQNDSDDEYANMDLSCVFEELDFWKEPDEASENAGDHYDSYNKTLTTCIQNTDKLLIKDFENHTKYFEMQLISWMDINEAPYTATYCDRIEEIYKFIDCIHNQLDVFINTWLDKHNLTKDLCPNFLTERLDHFYAEICKKYVDLHESIENAKIEYGLEEASD